MVNDGSNPTEIPFNPHKSSFCILFWVHSPVLFVDAPRARFTRGRISRRHFEASPAGVVAQLVAIATKGGLGTFCGSAKCWDKSQVELQKEDDLWTLIQGVAPVR